MALSEPAVLLGGVILFRPALWREYLIKRTSLLSPCGKNLFSPFFNQGIQAITLMDASCASLSDCEIDRIARRTFDDDGDSICVPSSASPRDVDREFGG